MSANQQANEPISHKTMSSTCDGNNSVSSSFSNSLTYRLICICWLHCYVKVDVTTIVSVSNLPVRCFVSVWCVLTLRRCRINGCVGQANHRSFLLTLSVLVLTSLYGISLVLGSLCPRQYLTAALFYCPGVYSQSRY